MKAISVVMSSDESTFGNNHRYFDIRIHRIHPPIETD
jgi:hypothetical protein